jgi:CRISPR-associated protein Cmr6
MSNRKLEKPGPLWSTRLSINAEQLRRANTGLRLDKFMDQENPDWKAVTQPRLDEGAYRLAYQRWEQHWTQEATGRIVAKGRLAGRLAMGLGCESVLEVGIRLNHSYGTPVIPGSAIKGVLRARIEDVALQEFLFGNQNSIGFTTFQDAWWIPESRPPLALDVMTVHHQYYYAKRGAPTDFDNPNPVQFLSVRGSFLFVAEFLGNDDSGRWKSYVEGLLKDTLEKEGIGGKRSAGYGRFQFGG